MPPIIAVSNQKGGVGKTTSVVNLATACGLAGLKTLVVDNDPQGNASSVLGERGQGISIYAGGQPIASGTRPNLWLIAAGQCSNRVVAALAQGHPLETLFNRLRGQFDFIVVDSCPVLPVADALLIGQHVDGVLISVLQDISQLPKVLNASERLSQLNIPLLGAVVNGVKTDIHAYGYNYVKQLPA